MSDRVIVAIPQETVNDETVRILAWIYPSGSMVRKDELICEAETSKAVMEIQAPEAGTLIYSAAVGDEVAVGATICEIVPEGQLVASLPELTSNGHTAPTRGPADAGPARLTKLALKVAAEYGLDVSSFPSGMLVRRDDVLRKAGRLPAAEPVAAKPARETERGRIGKNAPAAGVPLDWTDLPRRKMVERGILAAGQGSTIPSLVTSVCRAPKLRVRADKLGFKGLGFDALVVFEVARLLRKYSSFNAVFDGQRVGRYSEVNVGWAIDEGGKLVVPVIRQADQKSIAEIAAVMQEQLYGYISDSLAPAHFAGGTFTVTNLSGDGISFFVPLISQGQSAILGIGSDRSQNEEIFYLTLAFDHQITEGRMAARFLAELRGRLEAQSMVESDAAGDGAATEAYCQLCQRGKRELTEMKAILLKSEVPSGLVCSLCVAGWL
jgi:pyruvate/2-oxoglutarate dehydrogenase complex dihydrolipoamide acyltransferase (E2) component